MPLKTLLLASVDVARVQTVVSHYKSTKSLEVALVNFLKGCYEKGITDNVYSPHDFRHLYACNLYNETKDIVKVSTALNHSNIAVTDTYITALKRNSPIKTKTKIVSPSVDELEKVAFPSIDEYDRILTKYRTYHNKNVNIILDTLYFIARYKLAVSDFHIATLQNNTVDVEVFNKGFFVLLQLQIKK